MIKLSKKGGYALKAVLYIANNNSSVKIRDISKNEKISEALLRRIIANLEKSQILKTVKGRNGGVLLNKELFKISIYDILLSVGEELSISDCSKGLICENLNTCSTTKIINELQRGFNSLLKIYTIDKFLK